MTDKFTQTPSLSSQAIRHAQQWLAQEYEHYQGHDMPQASSGPTRARRSSMPEEMRPEEMVAQELRRIGDDFNYLYFQRIVDKEEFASDLMHFWFWKLGNSRFDFKFD
ncbi:B2L11 protein, partial [Polypterus senegalus]